MVGSVSGIPHLFERELFQFSVLHSTYYTYLLEINKQVSNGTVTII